jgi:predicted metal-binding protein
MAKWQVSVRCDNSSRNVQVEAETESTACNIAMDKIRNLVTERNQNKQISVNSVKKLN